MLDADEFLVKEKSLKKKTKILHGGNVHNLGKIIT